MPADAPTTLHAIVSGRVQGVGFRYFVYQNADRLGLLGEVRNLPDGSVEVKAQGSHDKLIALAEILRKGPVHSRVEDVKMDWGTPLEPFGRFSIKR